MNKTTKGKAEEVLQEKHSFRARQLLADKNYRQMIKRYDERWLFGKKVNKLHAEREKLESSILPGALDIISSRKAIRIKAIEDEILGMQFERNDLYRRICTQFNITMPYGIDELEEVARGEHLFPGWEQTKIVDAVAVNPNPGIVDPERYYEQFLDADGFLNVKINFKEPRYLIKYCLDRLMDAYVGRERSRHRTGMFAKEGLESIMEGKSITEIAREKTGISKPGPNKYVEATRKGISRERKKIKSPRK